MGSLRVSTVVIAVVACLSILLISPTEVDGRLVCDTPAGTCTSSSTCNDQCNTWGGNYSGGECADSSFPGLSICYCCHYVGSSAEMESM
ncbi:Defensin-like protein 98 [Arabidopsis thaliana]|uniref:Defensin-like protein 98 n=4 Tax=Arabidopsis TaxID=3701 RepID=DEF98_ARATH|nr:defensin-like protein [Arabidopsis thaliana]Q94AZ8.1 RecName: Full=Defensin-like protein 98; Flags: Precursor [Arabidopsis thaliana]KAG7616900.1 Low-molecular-weight cysteine-rich family [Arabidopsis thaliana x Arabidopsis arenosa]KAG7621376.1 Low-molecular-weight cysteine-rich family [Arabidopsis suecica]AAK73939.1 AT4g22230/T10I14_60 [Arabidopsis thaliana]AAM16186.1 AT4g22230/T10I14_60 [Arabidopsis thaliana]AAM61187.1 unknown [Arabidopsis thaliana]|eukprot:NP_567653.1 defensin-like protein [Arabidopsis thaliana]